MPAEHRIISFPLGLNADLVEQAFSRLIYEPWCGKTGGWMPALDVFETEREYLISVEAPGVPAAAVSIRADGTLLTISGERRSASVTQSSRVVKLERTWSRFSRSLTLGCPVDLSRMEVRSEEGVLHIRLPKLSGPALAAPGEAQTES